MWLVRAHVCVCVYRWTPELASSRLTCPLYLGTVVDKLTLSTGSCYYDFLLFQLFIKESCILC